MSFKLKYGQTELEIAQSETLIGIRPKPNQDDDANLAVERALQGNRWEEKGAIGGFRLIAMDRKSNADATLDAIRKNSAISSGTHVFEVPGGKGLFVPTGELFVEFKPGTPDSKRLGLIDKYRLSIREARGEDSLVVGITRQSPNPVKVAVALQGDPDVLIAEPDLATRTMPKALSNPLDALLSDQWHLRNSGFHRNTSTGFLKGADARVLDAWEAARTFGQGDVIVAIIDDGFDLRHPDLATPGKVVYPWCFTRKSADPSPGPDDWHGTPCAGVAVGGLGGGDIVGAAPGCSLMPVRWGVDLNDSQIEAWFGYVTRKGAAVVSCSWGAADEYYPLSTRMHRAIERCAKQGRGGKGCVVLFAAGNENRNINDPKGKTLDGFATHPNVIAVAASTSRDERADYSNFGKEISLCAPSDGAGGWGILTSDVTDNNSAAGYRGMVEGDYTYEFGGTSSACPLVAGIAALVLSVSPDLTSAEVKSLLQDTARKIGKPSDYKNGHSPHFGHGCVDAAAAVAAAMPRAQPVIAGRRRAAQRRGLQGTGARAPFQNGADAQRD